jgi:triacylglycerol lipase
MPAFDIDLARRLARYSARAYSEPNVHDDHTDTHALCVEEPDAFVLAFQGTRDARQWVTDGDFPRVRVNTGVSVHRGFLEAWEGIKKAPGLPMASSKAVYLTGHSLGGALAVLAASDRMFWGRVKGVYTFGQPRVGNSGFVADYRYPVSTWRIVNELDIIPRLPGVLIGYRHLHQWVMLVNGSMVVQPTFAHRLYSDFRCILKHWNRVIVDPVRDHFMASYLKAIGA